MELNEVVDKFGEAVSSLTDKVDGLSAQVAEQKEVNWDEKIEKALRAQFERPEVVKAEDQKKRARGYGFYQARKEFEAGNKSAVPNWDLDTELRFTDFVHAVKDGDRKAILKTQGDNAYTETTTAGGYLVPEEFRAELVRLAYVKSLMLQKCRIIPMSSDNLVMPTGGYETATWESINTQQTDTKVTFGQVSLTAAKLMGISIVPNELMSDSAIPIGAMLANEFAEAFGKKIDEEVLQGDATDTSNHKFNGWGYASSVEEVQPSAGDDTPTLAETLTEANLLSMVGKLTAIELAGAEWYFHPTVWATVRAIQDGSSSKIVRLNENWLYNLLGFPVNLSDQAPYATTNELPVGFFGNAQNIIIGDRMQFTIASSGDSRFSYDQTEFRATQRIAVSVALPSSIVRIVNAATA